MKEIKAIIDAHDRLDPQTTKAALATVVRVAGSSYRRVGARMLVLDNGQWVGGISGGCLEGDALKRARLAIAKATPSLITYDTTQDDAYQIGVGLGCNGVIDVLFAPLQMEDAANPVEILKNCLEQPRQTHVLLTITNLQGQLNGLRAGNVLVYTGRESLDTLGDDHLADALAQKIELLLENGKSTPKVFATADGREVEVFIEILPPQINVVLIGQQYDVYPLVRVVKEMGWRATVVGNLLKMAPKLSSLADAVISPDELETLIIDAQTAIVLMSHDFNTDKYNLPRVLKTTAPYVGMLGPRVRSERIFNELAAEGMPVSETDIARIFAPTGLDIGALSPEEIALSIVSEIRAVFSNRDGVFLRLRPASIHER